MKIVKMAKTRILVWETPFYYRKSGFFGGAYWAHLGVGGPFGHTVHYLIFISDIIKKKPYFVFANNS